MCRNSDESTSHDEPQEAPVAEKAVTAGKVSDATAVRAPTAKFAETVAAQKSLTKAVESAAAQFKVEGVTGGEVKIVSDPVMNEVVEGVYEVEAMPEVDLEALWRTIPTTPSTTSRKSGGAPTSTA